MSQTIAVIGCGNIGTSIVAGILDPTERGSNVFGNVISTVGTEASKRRVEETLSQHSSRLTVYLQQDNLRAVEAADVVLLGVKPIKREGIFQIPGFRDALKGKLIISIMAGISIKELTRLATGQPGEPQSQDLPQIVRSMPNMAARIREAQTLYTMSSNVSNKNLEIATWIFRQVGKTQLIAEDTFDISAVLVGCAGSLLLLAIDGLLDAAVAEGVKRSEAQEMAINSAIGIMRLVPIAGEHPSMLREKIASPGGCSIRALLELEKRGVRSAFTDAIMAAAERSKQMSKS